MCVCICLSVPKKSFALYLSNGTKNIDWGKNRGFFVFGVYLFYFVFEIIIDHIPPSFSSLASPFICFSPLSFKSTAPFPLTVIVCTYVYTYVSLSIACSVHRMVLVCVLSRLTIRTGKPTAVLFPGDERLSHFQLSSVAYGSLGRVEDWWPFFYPLWCVHWCHPCSVHV